MRIAVEGCAHGELDTIYEAILESEKIGKKVDLLLCCGDFQATRNWQDLRCMAVPDKYKDMGTFYKYYSGEKIAPVLTIFIGGNHEASNYLQELSYGGWVAPNIYYLGYAGVVNVADVRIAGFSGIYKGPDYMKGHFEYPPYSDRTMRSSYHIRNLEIFRLKQLSGPLHIFMSHDWPQGVTNYGDVKKLLRKKPFFKNDIERNCLGSPPAMELLKHHYPQHWFAAHLHCEFAALVPNDDCSKVTKFLALDKCLPKRRFLQIIEVEHNTKLPIKLAYDLEWLTILHLTNHLLSVKSSLNYMPGSNGQGRWNFTPTTEEMEKVLFRFNEDLYVPLNFLETVEPYAPESPNSRVGQPNLAINKQTTELCKKLILDDPFELLKVSAGIVDVKNKNRSFETSTPSKKDKSTDLSCSTEVSHSTEEEDSSLFVVDTKPSSSSEQENSSLYVIDTKPSSNARPIMSPLKLPSVIGSSAENEDSPLFVIDTKPSSYERPMMSPLKLPSAIGKSAENEDLPLFVIDTKPSSTPRSIMTPLKLPNVKGDNSTIFISDNETLSPVKLSSPKTNGTICLDDESPQKSVQSNNSSKSPRSFDEMQDGEVSKTEVEPNCKKFKRRNQSIYVETD